MLILTRKTGNKLKIGADICVEIISVQRNQVRLGIEAPKHIPILRNELSLDQMHHYQNNKFIKE